MHINIKTGIASYKSNKKVSISVTVSLTIDIERITGLTKSPCSAEINALYLCSLDKCIQGIRCVEGNDCTISSIFN